MRKTKRLSAAEWSFHLIEDTREYRAAWEWELHRAAGSNGIPWLDMTAEQRSRVREYFDRDWIVEETDLDQPGAIESIKITMNALEITMNALEGTSDCVHLLRIDWGAGLPQVKEALANCAEQAAKNIPNVGAHSPPRGRKNQYFSWLVDLAIYRAYDSGIRGDALTKELEPIFKKTAEYRSCDPQHHWNAFNKTKQRLSGICTPTGTNFRLTALFPDLRIK